MKRRFILSIFFVTSIVAGLIYIGQASAQKGNVRTAKSAAAPEVLATQALLVDDFTASPGTPLTATGWNAADLAGKWVLDVGCGAGRFAEVALRAGAKDFQEMGATRGYFGRPAEGTAAEGEALYEEMGKILADAVMGG